MDPPRSVQPLYSGQACMHAACNGFSYLHLNEPLRVDNLSTMDKNGALNLSIVEKFLCIYQNLKIITNYNFL